MIYLIILVKEYDVVISTGEQVSVGLLSAALNDNGIDARTCLGWQVPIITSSDHMSARIEGIKSEFINAILKEQKVCVIPDFKALLLKDELQLLVGVDLIHLLSL